MPQNNDNICKINAHFHPNFSFFISKLPLGKRFTEGQAKKIWRNISDLDVVFVSEHVFKNPKKAFALLEEMRPPHVKTRLIRAVEALTQEGMDVVVFSGDPEFYNRTDIAEIFVPFRLTYEELKKIISEAPSVYAMIPHPFCLTKTGIHKHFQGDNMKQEISKFQVVEGHNSSYLPLKTIIVRLKLEKIAFLCFPKFWNGIQNTEVLPEDYIEEDVTVLFGGDEHHAGDVGGHLEISEKNLPECDYELIEWLMGLGKKGKVIPKKYKFFEAGVSSLRQLFTAVHEGVHRRGLKALHVLKKNSRSISRK